MGKTPLELASAEGRATTARLLLGAGADANLSEAVMGFAPLHTAAGKGFSDVAEALLEGGADLARQNEQVSVDIMMLKKKPLLYPTYARTLIYYIVKSVFDSKKFTVMYCMYTAKKIYSNKRGQKEN